MIQLMSDDPARGSQSFRERVEDYQQKSANHREKIPFVMIEHYQGNLPDSPPEWIENDSDLHLYWKIADALAELYSHPLMESFGDHSDLLVHADRYHSSDEKPDDRLYSLSRQTDLSFKDWCRSMEAYLRERDVMPHTQ